MNDNDQLIFGIAIEDLIRKHYPNIKCFTDEFIFFPNTTAIVTKLSEETKSVTSYTAIDDIITDYYLISPSFVLRINTYGSSAREDREFFMEDRVDPSSNTNKIVTTLYTSDIEVATKIYDIILQNGGYRLHNKAALNECPIIFAFGGSDGYVTTVTKKFTKIPLDSIQNNYKPNTTQKVRETINTIQQTQHGIVIIQGPPGTGKTYLVRSILSEVKDKQAVICLPASLFLSNFKLLAETVSRYSASLIVLEDVGELLSIANVTHHEDATSILLNITEGLVSLIANTIFITTFNYDIGKINPSLIRPGRCLGRIELCNLPKDHAERIIGSKLPEALTKKEFSLAEIYEIKAKINIETYEHIDQGI